MVQKVLEQLQAIEGWAILSKRNWESDKNKSIQYLNKIYSECRRPIWRRIKRFANPTKHELEKQLAVIEATIVKIKQEESVKENFASLLLAINRSISLFGLLSKKEIIEDLSKSENYNYVELHCHTNASDGKLTPTQLVKFASDLKLRALAITDHDSVEGIEEALIAGEQYGIEVIPGVELSCAYDGLNGKYDNREFHMTGLFINHKNKSLIKTLNKIRNWYREKRVKLILKKLKNNFDIKISFKEILKINKELKCQLGMVQVIQLLINRGYAKNWEEASIKYGEKINLPVPFSAEKAIKLIRGATGLSFIAHPLNSMFSEKPVKMESPYNVIKDCFEMLSELKEKGLDGIEAAYTYSTFRESEYLTIFAKKLNLILSGGTDFHKEGIIHPLPGSYILPYSLVEEMKKCRKIKFGI